MEKTYSNNNRAKVPKVLRPTEISSLFHLQNILLFHNIGIFIFIDLSRITYTSYELQYNAQARPPPHLSVKNCNIVRKNPEAQCLSQI
jgi:uncharacterized membrane protein